MMSLPNPKNTAHVQKIKSTLLKLQSEQLENQGDVKVEQKIEEKIQSETEVKKISYTFQKCFVCYGECYGLTKVISNHLLIKPTPKVTTCKICGVDLNFTHYVRMCKSCKLDSLCCLSCIACPQKHNVYKCVDVTQHSGGNEQSYYHNNSYQCDVC